MQGSFANTVSQTHSAYQNTDLSIVKEERYVFKADWYDKQAELIRNYLFTFYPKDATVELVSQLSLYFSNLLFPAVLLKEQEDVHEKDPLRCYWNERPLPGLHFEREL